MTVAKQKQNLDYEKSKKSVSSKLRKGKLPAKKKASTKEIKTNTSIDNASSKQNEIDDIFESRSAASNISDFHSNSGAESFKSNKKEKISKIAKSDENVNKLSDTDRITVKSDALTPLANFNLSESTEKALRARGVESLFPIQAASFHHIRSGKDLIGRARTGSKQNFLFI